MWPCQASVQLPKAHGSIAATKGNEVMGEGSLTNGCTELTVGVEGRLFVRLCVCVCEYFHLNHCPLTFPCEQIRGNDLREWVIRGWMDVDWRVLVHYIHQQLVIGCCDRLEKI